LKKKKQEQCVLKLLLDIAMILGADKQENWLYLEVPPSSLNTQRVKLLTNLLKRKSSETTVPLERRPRRSGSAVL